MSRPQTASAYNFFARPTTASDPSPPPDDSLLQTDPRHRKDTPWPWLRYFMPKDFEVREGDTGNVFYQYFDVKPSELQEDLSVPPPKWCPGAYYRLSFTQFNVQPGQTVALTPPGASAANCAGEAIRSDILILAEGNENFLQEIKLFCQSVASFTARTWRDAFPLVDLLRGVVMYLLGQMEAGQQLAIEYARRDMLGLVDKERQRIQAEADARLEAMRAEIEAEAERRIANAGDETRRRMQEETLAQLRAEKEENSRLTQRLAQQDKEIKKLTESLHALQRQLDSQTAELEGERRDRKQSMQEKDRELAESRAATAACQEGLVRSRVAIMDALKARTKQEVMAVACAAVSAVMPGVHAYVAELRDVLPADSAAEASQASASEMLALKKQPKYLAGVVDPSLPPFTPGFLATPQAVGDMLHVGGGAATDVVPEASEPTTYPPLMFKYVHASPDQAFMVGQSLASGQGVSWDVLAAKEVFVPDVAANRAVKFFRPPPGGGAPRAYLALPLTGLNGEVLGMLAADSVSASDDADKQFVREMAKVVQLAIIRDQEAVAKLRAMAVEEVEEPPPLDKTWVDPEPHADMEAGLQAWTAAMDNVKAIGAADLEELKSQEKPDESTLAVVRAVLGAMGMADGNTAWDVLRSRITPDLMGKMGKLSHDDAWALWDKLCLSLKPVLALQAAGVDTSTAPRTRVGAAFGQWTSAISKISAARAVRKVLEERLKRANEKLISTFVDGGSALVELRSYRIPPKHTLAILQMCFLLLGKPEDEYQHWGKMRVQTNYKMIKALTGVKTREVPPATATTVFATLNALKEGDVKKESLAALSIWRWFQQFKALVETELEHAKLKVL